MKTFAEKVYEIVAQIPRGSVMSYGEIAAMIGHPRAARQVGWAMHRCPDDLPWQRVVCRDGTIANRMDAAQQRFLLQAEGVRFLPDGRVDLTALKKQNAKHSQGKY